MNASHAFVPVWAEPFCQVWFLPWGLYSCFFLHPFLRCSVNEDIFRKVVKQNVSSVPWLTLWSWFVSAHTAMCSAFLHPLGVFSFKFGFSNDEWILEMEFQTWLLQIWNITARECLLLGMHLFEVYTFFSYLLILGAVSTQLISISHWLAKSPHKTVLHVSISTFVCSFEQFLGKHW